MQKKLAQQPFYVKTQSEQYFSHNLFICLNDFCCFSYHPTRKSMQEKGTAFIAILKLSLNNKNMSKQLATL